MCLEHKIKINGYRLPREDGVPGIRMDALSVRRSDSPSSQKQPSYQLHKASFTHCLFVWNYHSYAVPPVGLHCKIMMQIFLCCLFGLLFIQVSAVPPENCQEDYDPVCRTDFRYRLSHDWIPYANASSGDGIRWRVLVDQHDYQNIFGSQNVPPGVWKEVDVDGDGLNVSSIVGS